MQGHPALSPALITTYQSLAKTAVEQTPAYPPTHTGRGIVTCAGGAKYFPCVWVTLHELRRLGCTLPVEVWHLGSHEMTPEMEALLAPLDVALSMPRKCGVLAPPAS